MRVLKLFFKAYLPLLTLIWIILLLVFSFAVSLSFHLGHFINADKLPRVLLVGLGPVVGQIPLSGERYGVFVYSPLIDEVVVIGTDGREVGAEGAG